MDAVENYKIIEKIASGNSGDIYKVQDLKEEIKSIVTPLAAKLSQNQLFQNVLFKHYWGVDTIRHGEKVRGERGRICLALKLFRDDISTEENFSEHFKKYFEVAIDFNHDNIIDLNYMGEVENKLYYVMEYVNGVSIEREIATCGAYFEPTACRIIYQTLQAIVYLHNKGIIHGNITSENIILSNNTKPKLHTKIYSAVKNDAWGIIENKKPHFKKDIYDLGLVFYRMLTGKMDVSNILEDVKNIDVSNDAREVLVQMLSDDGYKDCQQIIECFEQKDLLSVKF